MAHFWPTQTKRIVQDGAKMSSKCLQKSCHSCLVGSRDDARKDANAAAADATSAEMCSSPNLAMYFAKKVPFALKSSAGLGQITRIWKIYVTLTVCTIQVAHYITFLMDMFVFQCYIEFVEILPLNPPKPFAGTACKFDRAARAPISLPHKHAIGNCAILYVLYILSSVVSK